MTDYTKLIERLGERYGIPDLSTDQLLRRRDRKRRNQRIAAGVVGIAVFVAAIWIVTSVGSLDRSDTSVVPRGDVTGPAETGPAETGPAETGPAETGPAEISDDGWYDGGDPHSDIPPAGAVPSAPREGEVVAEYQGGLSPNFVFVYADGRVISWLNPGGGIGSINERRLTSEGVGLVRSGVLPPSVFIGSTNEVPADAWADPEMRPYVPSRYAVCFYRETGDGNRGAFNGGYDYPQRSCDSSRRRLEKSCAARSTRTETSASPPNAPR